jgi:subtilisin family serine protease
MRKNFSRLVIAFSIMVLFFSTLVAEASDFKKEVNNLGAQKVTDSYVSGEIVVKYRKSRINLDSVYGRLSAQSLNTTKSLKEKENLRNLNVSLLTIADGKSVEEKIIELQNDPRVEYAEPNYKRIPTEIATNDTFKHYLWGLDNTGQVVSGVAGIADADMDAPEAWAINEGTNSSVTVAVIDTGVAYNHPDLIGNMWNGLSCKDESGMALGNCNYGYDFADNDKTPLPTNHWHGTHVAGTIAATKNNNKGVVGVAANSKIMALKFGFDTASEVRAIDFAIQNGAKVINASYGGGGFSQTEYNAIERFKNYGGIFVAAAGNGGVDGVGDNNETAHFYPSDYTLDNIISVAATNQIDGLASFSNYGTTSVDVGAPGTNIYSTTASQTTKINETFEGTVPPAVPSGWITAGTPSYWGTYNLPGLNKVLYGDAPNIPYANNVNSTVTPVMIDLSDATGASISFSAACDTEYTDPDIVGDFMALELSSDGVNFTEIGRWNELTLDNDSDPDNSPDLSELEFVIPENNFTVNFKLRFRWFTDATNNPLSDYDGCFVNDVNLVQYSDGSDEPYAYSQGTSMASPHVAGLAALIGGYKSDLTYSQIRSIILNSGDNLPTLAGKTTTGKRINAQGALLQTNLHHINIAPNTTQDITAGQTITFTAQGQDQENNNIAGLTYTWTGTSAADSGIFNNTTPGAHLVKASCGGIESASVTVNVASSAPVTPSTPMPTPVYRFWKTNGTHFYTANEAEKNNVIARWPGTYKYEGIVYSINNNNSSNNVPLYRLWNTTGSHFYTTSYAEAIQATVRWPAKYKLEGVVYSVSSNPNNGIPVYRFYNMKNGTHFYTANEAEKNNVIARWPATYKLEGIVYYLGQ